MGSPSGSGGTRSFIPGSCGAGPRAFWCVGLVELEERAGPLDAMVEGLRRGGSPRAAALNASNRTAAEQHSTQTNGPPRLETRGYFPHPTAASGVPTWDACLPAPSYSANQGPWTWTPTNGTNVTVNPACTNSSVCYNLFSVFKRTCRKSFGTGNKAFLEQGQTGDLRRITAICDPNWR